MSMTSGDEFDLIGKFNELLKIEGLKRWDTPLELKRFQVCVAREILEALKNNNFVVVSMPTGSGKTLIEEFVAFYAVNQGFNRILVLEPTRFLCDQMYRRQWSVVFNEIVGREYEGNCADFLDSTKKIVISTPQTALKCVNALRGISYFDFVIIDEVHHAFGNKYYRDLLKTLRPRVVAGFTALLPSDKLLSEPDYGEILDSLKLLHYDFKKLKEMDLDFRPPLAVVDIYDSELDEDEVRMYDILLRSGLPTASQFNAFLEKTLVSYGRKAFCESCERLIENGKLIPVTQLEEFCRSSNYSHKVRTMLDVLRIYEVPSQQGKLSLIYTTRRITAHEAGRAVETILSSKSLEVLTGDMSGEDRLNLLTRLREGEVSVLISTRVGEEGVDLPEAWLLVMLDVVKSPMRFYQRIGRLIRMGSTEKLKHLVLILTPGTYEYDDLEKVLWRLYEEGVDVSYILTNIDLAGRTTVDHVVDTIARIQEQISAKPSFSFLVHGREPDSYSIIKAIEDSSRSKEFIDTAKEVWKEWWGIAIDESDEFFRYWISSALWSVLGTHKLRHKLLEDLGISEIKRNKLYKLVNEAIEEGKLYYIYDIDTLADMIEHGLTLMYRKCLERPEHYVENCFFRLDMKELLRHLTIVFTPDKLDSVVEELEEEVNTCMKEISELKAIATIDEGNIEADLRWRPPIRENPRQKALIYQERIWLYLGGCSISLKNAQISYYDIKLNNLMEREKILKLFKLNTEAIFCKGVVNFLKRELNKNSLKRVFGGFA